MLFKVKLVILKENQKVNMNIDNIIQLVETNILEGQRIS